MNSGIWLWFSALVSILFMSPCLSMEASEDMKLPDGLGKGTYLQRLERERRDTIQAMIGIVTAKERSVEERVEAIRVLGLYRAKEAIPILIDNITFSPYEFVKDLPSLDELYPCLPALVTIGSPTSEALLDRIGEPASEIQTKLLLQALCQIETPEFARSKIEKRRNLLVEADKKERLSRLLRGSFFSSLDK